MGREREHKNRARGRFKASRIGQRLEDARAMAGLGQKDIGLKIWPAQSADSARQTWSKKCGGHIADFSLEEIEIAVNVLSTALATHPDHPELRGTKLPGFPFIDLRESRQLEVGKPSQPGDIPSDD